MSKRCAMDMNGYRSCGNERDNRLCKARCKFYEQHCIYNTLSTRTVKALCAAGIKDIYYINDYRNDELVDYFSAVAKVPVKKIDE